jgi:hypothetical protein
VFEIGDRDLEILAEEGGETVLFDHSLAHEDRTEGRMGRALGGEGCRKLLLGDDALGHEQLTNAQLGRPDVVVLRLR